MNKMFKEFTDKFWSELQKKVPEFPNLAKDNSVTQLLKNKVISFVEIEYPDSPEQFLKEISEDQRLYQKTIEATRIHETYFFREPAYFELLNRVILREIIQRKKTLRVWSAACSTGEEYYSILMSVLYTSFIYPEHDIKVMGTDISTAALERARLGIYSNNSLRLLPTLDERLAKIFHNCYIQEGKKYKPQIFFKNFAQEKGTLERHDLLRSAYPVKQDIIFLRNILFYYNEDQQHYMLSQCARSLNPGGYLFLSSIEIAKQFWKIDSLYKENLDDLTFFRKEED